MFRQNLSRRDALLSLGAGVCALTFGDMVFASKARAQKQGARIAFMGDSMIDGIWASEKRDLERDACLKQAVSTGRYAENGSGLARADKFHWPEKAAKIMTEFQPDLVVASFGLNDRQGVVDNERNVRVEFGNPEWEARYREQVTAFLKSAGTGRAGLLWLGLPVLREKEANEDATSKNRIFRETIKAFGDEKVAYVEPWRIAGPEGDAYQAYMTEASGAKLQIRSPDGIHFTRAGYDLISAYLGPQILSQLKSRLAADWTCEATARSTP